MKFNELKRKTFFWIEKLQISRSERISVTILLVVLVVLFAMSFFLQKTFNYSQDNYDAITQEFEKRSEQLRQEQKELAEKYTPNLAVSEAPESDMPTSETGSPQTEEIANEPTGLININTATSAQLQKLDGIGDTYAQRIIEYREVNGGFDSIDELINVKGIGEKRLENIRPYIKLKD